MLQININSDLFITQPMPDGTWTCTLASRLGDMLDMAEELFGPRDCSYTILGIEFTPDEPHIQYLKNRRQIIIQLSLQAATDMQRADYDLAHETVHLLAPTGGRHATNLEEGIACYFANYYMKKEFNAPPFPLWENHVDYKRALKAVTPLLDEDLCCLRGLREHQPSFRDMTKEDIIEEFPNLGSKDVDFLIEKFDKDSNG